MPQRKPAPVKVARAIIFAERHGPEAAAKKFDVSKRTINRWRLDFLGEDSETGNEVQQIVFDLRLVHAGNVDLELTSLLLQMRDKLGECLQNFDVQSSEAPAYLLGAIVSLAAVLDDRAIVQKLPNRKKNPESSQ